MSMHAYMCRYAYNVLISTHNDPVGKISVIYFFANFFFYNSFFNSARIYMSIYGDCEVFNVVHFFNKIIK